MDADMKSTGSDGSPPPESGTLLELSADDPGILDDSLTPEPGEVVLQISGEAVDVREDAPTDEPPRRPPLETAWSLLWLASPRERHYRLRRRLAGWLVRTTFWPPLRTERYSKVQEHVGAGPRKIHGAAEDVLLRTVAVWGREDGRARYSDFTRSVRNTLNDEVAQELLGPDARKLWRSDEGEAPDRLDAILDARDDDEEQGAALPEAFEVRALGPDALIARRELGRLLDLAEFGRGELQCWELCELRGLSCEEAAEVTGYTEGTVETKVSRARGALQDAAEELTG